jgi:hypothetical protein
LVAIGAQDVVLTGDPEITFFSALYRPYVNFAMESQVQTIQGQFRFGQKASVDIARNGDLITKMILQLTLPQVTVTGTDPTFQWAPNIGNTMLKNTTITIGGTDIDKQFGDFYNIWNELTMPAEKLEGYNTMIGQQNLKYNKTDPADIVVYEDGLQTPLPTQPQATLQIPLFFWFCTNSGLALPLIALQYHSVRVSFEIRPFVELYRFTGSPASSVTIVGGNPEIISPELWVDYIFLDNAERKNYAKSPHEYLITQLQETDQSITQSNFTMSLKFNHPSKELIWVVQEDYVVAQNVNDWTNWEVANDTYPAYNATINGVPGDNPLTSALLKVNGNDRFQRRIGEYFNLVQPWHHHTRIPKSKGVFVYSFALNPEDFQPSGTLNYSRVDNSDLMLALKNINTSNPGKVYVYDINVNLFRVANGMGGLAYAS